jgi:hypothetical protein
MGRGGVTRRETALCGLGDGDEVDG